jgi:hypothetical protein
MITHTRPEKRRSSPCDDHGLTFDQALSLNRMDHRGCVLSIFIAADTLMADKLPEVFYVTPVRSQSHCAQMEPYCLCALC